MAISPLSCLRQLPKHLAGPCFGVNFNQSFCFLSARLFYLSYFSTCEGLGTPCLELCSMIWPWFVNKSLVVMAVVLQPEAVTQNSGGTVTLQMAVDQIYVCVMVSG
jgi:hypothetical protein